MSEATAPATAETLMTPNPIVLESSMSIQEAVDVFTKHKISSAPVNTTMGDVGGQLTELVLVRALVLHQLQPEKFQKLAHCTDFLEEAVFVQPKDSITVVMKALLKSSSRRVLVKSEGRKIFGIISPKDMLRALVQGHPEAKAMTTEIAKLGAGKL
jgi:predicted transcriptional regulator